MGVRRFEELQAWQLSRDVKKHVYALVDGSPAKDDFKFRDQIVESARSAPAAIAEGFGRYHHPEFSYLAGVAKASLNETKNHLLDGMDRNHWTEGRIDELLKLTDRAIGAVTNLIKYLDRTDPPGGRRPRRR